MLASSPRDHQADKVRRECRWREAALLDIPEPPGPASSGNVEGSLSSTSNCRHGGAASTLRPEIDLERRMVAEAELAPSVVIHSRDGAKLL